MKNPLVSCIIPTYKRSDTLVRAIESALVQTYTDIEILIVDDNEPDDEYSKNVQYIIHRFSSLKIRYIRQNHHKNGASARNYGVKMAYGKYVAFLDDDDVWCKTKLEKQVNALESSDNAKIATCYIEQYLDGKYYNRRKPYSINDLQYRVLKREISVGTATILIDRDSFILAGGFNEDLIRNQEVQMISMMLDRYEIVVVPEYLVYTNMEFGNESNNPDATIVEKIKLDFLKSVESIIVNYPHKKQRNIYAANYFEIVFVAVKYRKMTLALKYLLKIGFNVDAYKDLFRRYRNRRKE